MLVRIACFFVLTFFISFVLAERTHTRTGYAYDQKTNDLIYSEIHYEKYKNGLILHSNVIYKNPESNVIARKRVDFIRNSFLPEFSLQNNFTGHLEITSYAGDKYKIIFVALQGQAEQTATIEYPSDAVGDAGFDNLIIRYWQQIITGEVLRRDFLVPSMLDFVKFRIYQKGLVDENGQFLRVIHVEPDNFFVRAFATRIKLYYDKNAPRLRRFEGISNIRDKQGDNYHVIIRYRDASE